nr:MAG TPA: hypothetical protein [Siphoviridae sp. ctngg6]
MKIKENIVLVAALIATLCSIFMFWLGWDMGEKSYSIKDTTIYSEEDLTGSYNVGFEDGLHEAEEALMASHTEIVENWLCNLQDVTINGDVIHIVDGNGEEWVITAE